MTDIFYQQADIEARRKQYKEQMMSKNPNNGYQIETRSNGGDFVTRMDHTSAVVLDNKGQDWIKGKFCDEYRVTAK